jgi:hypothetical protein
MAIEPDCRESMHVGMASPPHTASSRARLSGSTIDHPMRLRSRGARLNREGNPTLRVRAILVTVLRKRPDELFNLSLDLLSSHPGSLVSYGQHRSNEQYGGHPATYRHSGESHGRVSWVQTVRHSIPSLDSVKDIRAGFDPLVLP